MANAIVFNTEVLQGVLNVLEHATEHVLIEPKRISPPPECVIDLRYQVDGAEATLRVAMVVILHRGRLQRQLALTSVHRKLVAREMKTTYGIPPPAAVVEALALFGFKRRKLPLPADQCLQHKDWLTYAELVE